MEWKFLPLILQLADTLNIHQIISNDNKTVYKFLRFQEMDNLGSKKIITKTCLYNFDPLKPHFYMVKLGFTGVYIIFVISAQKHRLWVLVRTASPRRF